MRAQVQYEQEDHDVYIAIGEEKVFNEGSIELYKNVLNECVHNGTVDPFVKNYILDEYKGLKFIFRTRNKIRDFAESLQKTFNQWQESPERKRLLESLILCRVRRNRAIWMIASLLTVYLGYYIDRHDDHTALATTVYIIGCGNVGLWTCSMEDICHGDDAKKKILSCIKNRLSHNLDKQYVYSIFSSKNLIRDDFKDFLESDAGKIENIGQIVTGYLL